MRSHSSKGRRNDVLSQDSAGKGFICVHEMAKLACSSCEILLFLHVRYQFHQQALAVRDQADSYMVALVAFSSLAAPISSFVADWAESTN